MYVKPPVSDDLEFMEYRIKTKRVRMGTIVTYVSSPYYHQVQKGEGRVISQSLMLPSHNMRSPKSLYLGWDGNKQKESL
jgi:hypothetical protein